MRPDKPLNPIPSLTPVNPGANACQKAIVAPSGRPASRPRLAAILCCWFAALLATTNTLAETPEAVRITLPQAIAMALDSNPVYLNSLDYVEMAAIDYESARAIYRTKFRSSTATDARSGADVGSTYSLYLDKLNPSGSQVSAGLYNYNFADKSLSEFRVSYTLPWFRDPLKDGNLAVEEKEMSLKREKLLAEISQQELINEVVAVYYQLALANEAVNLGQLQQGIAQRIVASAEIRHRDEIISAIELARYRLQLSTAEQALQQALFDQQRSETMLRYTLGIEGSEPIALGPANLSHIDIGLQARTVAELEDIAMANRVEIAGKRDELSILRRKVALATGTSATGMDISLQYALVGESESFADSLDFNDQRFGLGLNMDTDFGSGERSRGERLLYLQYQTEGRNLVQLREKIRMEVRQAYFNLSRTRQLMDIAAGAVAIAEQEYRKASIRHNAGLVDNVELLEAELALEEARVKAFNSRVNYLMAGQTLTMACGQFRVE